MFDKNIVAATANRLLDSISALAILRHPETFAMTLKDVCDEAALVNGERVLNMKQIWCLEKHPDEIRKHPLGLEKTAIYRVFYTSSGIAIQCQEFELSLRVADFEKKSLDYLIRKAEEFLRDTRRRVERLYQADDAATLAEWNLDCAAVDSLAQQVLLYRAARSDRETQAARLYADSLNFGRDVRKGLHDAISACPNAEAADLILAGRSLLNAFFAVFMLDKYNGDQTTLPRSLDFARSAANHQMLLTGFKAAIWTNDPRLALYLGELAGLAYTGRKPRGAINVRSTQPSPDLMVTAARLVYLAKKLDRNEQTAIRDWRPGWLTGRWLSQLEPAINLVELDERLAATVTEGV